MDQQRLDQPELVVRGEEELIVSRGACTDACLYATWEKLLKGPDGRRRQQAKREMDAWRNRAMRGIRLLERQAA